MTDSIPIIDISALCAVDTPLNVKQQVAAQIGKACEDIGFFYVSNHNVPSELHDGLFEQGRRFFSQPLDFKREIDMSKSRVFRGYFAVGEELTSGRKDHKEGLYFCDDLPDDHPKVTAGVFCLGFNQFCLVTDTFSVPGVPMHGKNLYPREDVFPHFGMTVQGYMAAMVELGHNIMEGIALSLGIEANYFREKFTSEPFTPFRLFYYPADPDHTDPSDGGMRWGVGEHTDYGMLSTHAKQSSCGHLCLIPCRSADDFGSG